MVSIPANIAESQARQHKKEFLQHLAIAKGKVNCDLQLTLMASSLYRLLGSKLGNGYETAKSRHIFRDFIDAAAAVQIEPGELLVPFQKRAHNPLLIASGFADIDVPIPWIGRKRLRFLFG